MTYKKDFFCLPIAVTVNNTTKNLQLLRSHDFLADRDNVKVLSFAGRPGETPPAETLPL